MEKVHVLELHIVMKSKVYEELFDIEENLVNLVIKEHGMETTYEIAGGIREADDGEKKS